MPRRLIVPPAADLIDTCDDADLYQLHVEAKTSADPLYRRVKLIMRRKPDAGRRALHLSWIIPDQRMARGFNLMAIGSLAGWAEDACRATWPVDYLITEEGWSAEELEEVVAEDAAARAENARLRKEDPAYWAVHMAGLNETRRSVYQAKRRAARAAFYADRDSEREQDAGPAAGGLDASERATAGRMRDAQVAGLLTSRPDVMAWIVNGGKMPKA